MMTTRCLLLLAVLQCTIYIATAHSWLDCINVANARDLISLANINCTGYPANFVGRSVPDGDMYKVEGISQDAWPSTPCCKTTSRTYTTTYPMTKLKAGESFTIGYTPNGHTSWMKPNPPPHGSQNFYIKWNPNMTGTTMVTMNDMIVASTLSSVLFETPCHNRITGAELNPSDGLCAFATQIPPGTRPGVYQMVWYWPFRFQGPSFIEDYMTCFDVEVLPGGAAPTTSPSTGSSSGSTTTGQATTGTPTTPKPTPTTPTSAPTTPTSAPTTPTPAPTTPTTTTITTKPYTTVPTNATVTPTKSNSTVPTPTPTPTPADTKDGSGAAIVPSVILFATALSLVLLF